MYVITLLVHAYLKIDLRQSETPKSHTSCLQAQRYRQKPCETTIRHGAGRRLDLMQGIFVTAPGVLHTLACQMCEQTCKRP